MVSVEDHGYVLNLGLDNKRGFLRRKHADAYIAQLPEGNHGLQIGTVMTGVALKASGSARAVSLSVDPAKVAKTSIVGGASTGLATLTPGTLVDCTVTGALGFGLTLEFFDLSGTVDAAHLYVMFPESLAPTVCELSLPPCSPLCVQLPVRPPCYALLPCAVPLTAVVPHTWSCLDFCR